MHRIVNILGFVGCGGFCGNYSVCCRDEKAAVDHAQANAQLVLSNTVCKKQQGNAGKGQNLLALVDISSSKISYDLHAEEKYLEFPCGWSMLKVAHPFPGSSLMSLPDPLSSPTLLKPQDLASLCSTTGVPA